MFFSTAGYSISTQSQLLLTAVSDICQKCCFQKRKRFVTTRLHSYNQLHKHFTFTLLVSFSLQSRSGREEILISCHEVPESKQLCLCQFLVDLLRRRRTCSMVSRVLLASLTNLRRTAPSSQRLLLTHKLTLEAVRGRSLSIFPRPLIPA